MKEKFNRIKGYAFRVMDVVSSHHTGAYAAQAAYFFCLIHDSNHIIIVNDGTIYLINKGLYYECCTAGISNDSRRVD